MSIVSHTFPVAVAKEVGVENAVMLSNLYFWVEKNKANNKNLHDGRFWTYNSMKAFEDIFPYWTFHQIRRILSNLERDGLLLVGVYNKNAYDRTKWYTLSDKALALFQNRSCTNSDLHLHDCTNGKVETNKPIPDINTDNKQDDKPNSINTPTQSVVESIRDKNSKPAIINQLLDAGLDKETAEEYWYFRATIKKDRPTSRAVQTLINECERSNIPLSVAVGVMIERGWKGFRAEWYLKEQRTAVPQMTKREQVEQHNAVVVDSIKEKIMRGEL